MSNEMIGNLPKNINKVVPTPNNNAKEVSKLVKDSGEVVGYMLSSGEVLSKPQAVSVAKNGGIKSVAVGVSKKGEEYLRSLPDGDEGNNLSNLPSISTDELKQQ